MPKVSIGLLLLVLGWLTPCTCLERGGTKGAEGPGPGSGPPDAWSGDAGIPFLAQHLWAAGQSGAAADDEDGAGGLALRAGALRELLERWGRAAAGAARAADTDPLGSAARRPEQEQQPEEQEKQGGGGSGSGGAGGTERRLLAWLEDLGWGVRVFGLFGGRDRAGDAWVFVVGRGQAGVWVWVGGVGGRWRGGKVSGAQVPASA